MLYVYNNVCQSNETTVNVQFLSPCNHEEADTSIFLHVKDMARNSYKKLAIWTVDTNVLFFMNWKLKKMSYGLTLELERIDASFKCMRFKIRSEKKEQEPCLSFMHWLGATKFPSFRMSRNSLHGRFVNCLMMSSLLSLLWMR